MGVAKIIAVANDKGGVGKTTIAVTLAVGLIKAGKKVAILSADENDSAIKWRKRRKEKKGVPFKGILPKDLFDVDVIDLEINKLGTVLNDLRFDYDVIILDTQASSVKHLIEVGDNADVVLVPLLAEGLGSDEDEVKSTVRMIKLSIMGRQQERDETVKAFFVINKAVKTASGYEELSEEAAGKGLDCLATKLCFYVGVARLGGLGRTALEGETNSEYYAQASSLINEVLEVINNV